MRKVAIIPARLGSSRFPNKPLAPILGRPMIEHVFKRTQLCRELDDVYVATCDREIADAVEKAGGKAIMTRPEHERGTDRIAEAALKVDADIIVNVQGDEPMIDPEMPSLALRTLQSHSEWGTVNLVSPIQDEAELRDVNQIKVITDHNGRALYMSRQPIPSLYGIKTFRPGDHFKQVCVIPFTRKVLQMFVQLEQTRLERYESIDMMRLIENGVAVGTAVWDQTISHAVDTPSDLKLVEGLLKADPLYQKLFG